MLRWFIKKRITIRSQCTFLFRNNDRQNGITYEFVWKFRIGFSGGVKKKTFPIECGQLNANIVVHFRDRAFFFHPVNAYVVRIWRQSTLCGVHASRIVRTPWKRRKRKLWNTRSSPSTWHDDTGTTKDNCGVTKRKISLHVYIRVESAVKYSNFKRHVRFYTSYNTHQYWRINTAAYCFLSFDETREIATNDNNNNNTAEFMRICVFNGLFSPLFERRSKRCVS